MGIFRSSFLHTKPSNFASGPNRMTQGKIRRFCMEKTGPKNAHISAANCSKQLNFGDWGIFHHALSKYVIASHNFTNSIFMTSSLYHSIVSWYISMTCILGVCIFLVYLHCAIKGVRDLHRGQTRKVKH